MNDEQLIVLARLMERAAQCRKLAVQAQSRGIAIELEKLAHDYDRDAAGLARYDSDHLLRGLRADGR